MKNFILISITILLIISCQKEEEISSSTVNGICDLKTELSAPEGFEINQIGSIDFNGSLHELQMVDENIGYMLGHSNVGGYLRMFKSEDGGLTWNSLNVNFNENPIDMYFINSSVGIISYYGNNGNILRTTDGGLTWNQLNFPELNGSMYHIQKDDDENLYSILWGLDTETVLIKSTDKGLSWDTLFSSSNLGFTLVTFSFQIFENKIFISGNEGKLIKIDKDGNYLNTIETNQARIWDLEIIDEDNLIVVSSGQTVKSSDGGETWQEIYDKSARIIGFNSSEKGIMLLNKSSCPTDVYQVNDVIAFTNTSGNSWVESNEYTNLRIDFANSQKMNDDRYIIVLRNALFELKEN